MNNFLYIPELDNLAINMDNVSKFYIYKDRYSYKWYLEIKILEEEWSKFIPNNMLDAVKYRLDMFFFGGSSQ